MAEVQSSSRVHFFDGLRGWAALTVLLHHISLVFPEWFILYKTPLNPLVSGDYAVFIFFILSGIVLSLGFFKTNDHSFLCGLAIKRIPRLSIPIFITCIATVILMKTGLMFNQEAAALLGNEWLAGEYNFEGSFWGATIFSFKNVLFFFDTSYNTTLWTIGYEIQGSFLVLILLCGVNYIQKNLWPFWVSLFLFILIVSPIFLSFALGVLISYIFVNNNSLITKLERSIPAKITAFALCFFTYLGFLLFADWGIDMLKQLMCTFSAFFLIVMILIMPLLRRFFSCGLSKLLGKLSFPLYIVHFPVICSFTSFLITHYEIDSMAVTALFSGLTIVAAFVAACAFYPAEKLSIFAANKLFQYAKGALSRKEPAK